MAPEEQKAQRDEKLRELEARIKELEQEKKKLEQEGQKEEEETQVGAEGVAGRLLEGIGGMIPGLGGFIKGLTRLEAVQERLKEVDQEVQRRFSEEPLKRVEEGRGPEPRLKPEAVSSRQFPVDVIDELDHLRVLAELPGLEGEDIRVDLQGNQLTISAQRGERRYHQTLSLPLTAKAIIQKEYKKGVLEVKLERG